MYKKHSFCIKLSVFVMEAQCTFHEVKLRFLSFLLPKKEQWHCFKTLVLSVCDSLRVPRLRFFRAFSSVLRQMPGQNPQRRGTARTLPNCCVVLCIFVLFYVLFVLCCSVYCLCVYVYCTTATGWLLNRS